jgi:hypothetical protein
MRSFLVGLIAGCLEGDQIKGHKLDGESGVCGDGGQKHIKYFGKITEGR